MMPTPESSPARDPRLQQVLERAAVDAAFRRRLLDEPHAAIRDAFGVAIPTSFRLRFVERGPDTDALIVLPNLDARGAAHRTSDEGALDDAELETVAGGWAWSPGAGGQGSTGAAGGGSWEWNPGAWSN